MLPERCEILWRAYLASETVRIHAQSIAALEAFIQELGTAPVEVRDRWAITLASRTVDHNDPTPVRMPLFRKVLFPVLLRGYQARLPGSARWLAGFAQLLYKSPECLANLPESARSAHGLLLAALEMDRNDALARGRLLHILRSRFEYALHELPAGVLYGQDGATAEQCDEMEEELLVFGSLIDACGTTVDDHDLLEESRFHIRAYREFLESRKPGDTYETFLASKRG